MVEANRADPSDAELVLAALRGDRDSFGHLVARHKELLLAMCRRVLGQNDAAEDAAQEAVLEAMVNLDRLRKPDSFGAWLSGIGLNVCRRWLRRRADSSWSWEAIQGGWFEPREPLAKASPEEAAEVAEMIERVRQAVNELPAGQRAAVVLYYLAGLNQQEVAATLEIRVGAVRGRLHKARKGLRERLWSMWREEMMESETEWIDVEVIDVRRSPAEGELRDRFVVLLEEPEGDQGLPIWIGPHEGTAIAMLLERAEMPRPMTFRFLWSMLEATGSRLAEVRINRLSEGTFYAEALVKGPRGRVVVDARPSDAIALSLLAEAPIRVSREVLTEMEREGTGSQSRFEAERQRYVEGAREIVQRTRREWEIQMEQLHSR